MVIGQKRHAGTALVPNVCAIVQNIDHKKSPAIEITGLISV